AFQEHAAVAARAQPRVADDDEPAVVEVADQPADALLQREDGLRNLKLRKRIAARAADRLDARMHERIAGRGERQLVDRDEPERTPAHVDALPEAARAEQHGVAVGAKGVQELAARASTLHE